MLSQSYWIFIKAEILKKNKIKKNCLKVHSVSRKGIFSSKSKKDITTYEELTSQKHKQSLIAYGKMS